MWFHCFDRVWWSLSLSLSLLSSLPYCYLTKKNLKNNVPNRNEWTSGVKQGVGKTICLYVVTDAVAPPSGNVSINTDRCSAVSPGLTPFNQSNQLPVLGHTHTHTYTHTHSHTHTQPVGTLSDLIWLSAQFDSSVSFQIWISLRQNLFWVMRVRSSPKISSYASSSWSIIYALTG